MRDIRIHSFDPVCDDKSRILILGTMPGRLSLLHYEYYANPGNCFWYIMARILGKEPVVDYYEKKKLLLDNNVALWDVLASCERKSSADSDIIDPAPNNFKSFLRAHPAITYVIFNGITAQKLYGRLVQKELSNDHIRYIKLPSTSPANARISREEKFFNWNEALKSFVIDIRE